MNQHDYQQGNNIDINSKPHHIISIIIIIISIIIHISTPFISHSNVIKSKPVIYFVHGSWLCSLGNIGGLTFITT